MNKMYPLKQTADRSGLSKDTILFYEKTGLIPPIARNEIGHRIYSQENVDTLQLIACLKRTGMSLEEIKQYLHLQISEDRYHMLENHKQKLAQQMVELQQVIDIKLTKLKNKTNKENEYHGI